VELMVTRNLKLLNVILLLGLPCLGQVKPIVNDLPVKLEVLSVRKMSSEEAARKLSDNIGVDVAVRLRLSNSGRRTIYFYAWQNHITPSGYTVRKTNGGIVWKIGVKESEVSPGIDPVIVGAWMLLEEGSAVEWEEFDISTASEETHAKTFFMKVGADGVVTEVLSEFYRVPARAPKQP
jgi:hypothetical protein